jgi:hypothetical protein
MLRCYNKISAAEKQKPVQYCYLGQETVIVGTDKKENSNTHVAPKIVSGLVV